jgi:hypothetical protein
MIRFMPISAASWASKLSPWNTAPMKPMPERFAMARVPTLISSAARITKGNTEPSEPAARPPRG